VILKEPKGGTRPTTDIVISAPNQYLVPFVFPVKEKNGDRIALQHYISKNIGATPTPITGGL
jgi:hypothetical protein